MHTAVEYAIIILEFFPGNGYISAKGTLFRLLQWFLPIYAHPEENMKSSTKPHLARLALLAATLAWGSTFLITKNTLDAIDTFYLLAIRFSGAALLLGLVFTDRCTGSVGRYSPRAH